MNYITVDWFISIDLKYYNFIEFKIDYIIVADIKT